MRKQFHVGDKIICTKNSDIQIYIDQAGEGTEEDSHDDLKVTMDSDGKYEEPANLALKTKTERLMNGNLYKIRAFCRASVVAGNDEDEQENVSPVKTSEPGKPSGSTSSREYFVLDDLSGEVIRACPKLLVKKTKITHAWALSIHKFQGSEAEVRNVQLIDDDFPSKGDCLWALWKRVRELASRLHRRHPRQEEGGDRGKLSAA